MSNDIFKNSIAIGHDIGANSVAFSAWDLVARSGGFLIKATTNSQILGKAVATATMAADNQTVDMVEVGYTKEGVLTLAADDTIANTDEGKYYLINSDQTVDVSTASTVESYVDTSDTGAAVDPVIKFQVQLVKYISQTASEYKIIK